MSTASRSEEIAPDLVFTAAPSCASCINREMLPITGGYAGG
jgi:hypothetical protein